MMRMVETAFHRRGHAAVVTGSGRRLAVVRGRERHRLVAGWSGLGVCVVGTHDPGEAAEAWNALVERRHASEPHPLAGELDASAWWPAQHRWAWHDDRGWRLVRDRTADAAPAMVLVGVFRD